MKSLTNPHADLNAIINEGAQTSNGGVLNEGKLCDALDISLELSPPRAVYRTAGK